MPVSGFSSARVSVVYCRDMTTSDLHRTQGTAAFADGVGIIVIGRNEGGRLINSLTSINPEEVTTVYVDSGSTDDSVTTAQRLGATVVNLDMTRPFTAARARNGGFAALKALRPEVRFVQFIDGDCELDTAWLATAFTFIAQHEDIAVVCGRRREKHPDASIYNWLCDMEWNTPIGEALACGGDSLVRVAAFEAVGGFLPQMIAGEEPDLCLRLRRIGWKIWRIDAEMTRHDAAMTRFGQWWRRAVRSGFAYAEGYLLYAGSPAVLWKRELIRAVIWAALVPLVILLGVLVNPLALAAALLYPIQVGRIAIRHGAAKPRSWAYGLFMTLGNFPALQGIIIYCWRRWRGHGAALIEYKQSG